MTTEQPNLLQLAKQGNSKAITALINHSLKPKGITAKAALKDGCLQVMLESNIQVPDQLLLVEFINRGVANLGVDSIKTLRVFGKQTGEDLPAWVKEIQLQNRLSHVPNATAIKKSQQFNAPNVLPQPNLESRASKLKVDEPLLESTPQEKAKLKWYETKSPALIIGLLVIFFPLGLWSMWKYAKWSLKTKGIITAVFSLLLLANNFSKKSDESIATSSAPSSPSIEPITPSSAPSSSPVEPRATASAFSSPSTSSSSTQSRTFLGKSQTGYELWADKSCIYVIGLTEGDLARLNTDVWGFKKVIKAQTGYTCVLFE